MKKDFTGIPYDQLPTDEEFIAIREAEYQTMLAENREMQKKYPDFAFLFPDSRIDFLFMLELPPRFLYELTEGNKNENRNCGS